MISSVEPSPAILTGQVDLATFYLGELLLGIDIRLVREINRQLEFTPVPHAPPQVRGVINLRGEVVTVMDLRTILGLDRIDISKQARNVIVHSRAEQIGLLVDRVADTVCTTAEAIEPVPANIHGLDAAMFQGVVRLESELVVILNVEAALADGSSRQ
jgi:purine-binding chemotaxis protein CheW